MRPGTRGRRARHKILADVPDYHATAPQAADAAREAGVGALAITHIVPPLPLKGLEAIFLADARERFTGPLWLAEDGDLYSLPAGGTGVERSSMFRPRARRLAERGQGPRAAFYYDVADARAGRR